MDSMVFRLVHPLPPAHKLLKDAIWAAIVNLLKPFCWPDNVEFEQIWRRHLQADAGSQEDAAEFLDFLIHTLGEESRVSKQVHLNSCQVMLRRSIYLSGDKCLKDVSLYRV